jgi:hypothetical protein
MRKAMLCATNVGLGSAASNCIEAAGFRRIELHRSQALKGGTAARPVLSWMRLAAATLSPIASQSSPRSKRLYE